MRNIFMLAILLINLNPAFAVDLQTLQGRNYIGTYGACGLHIEVSGNKLVMTDIIPPSMDGKTADCKYGPARTCNGVTEIFTCDASGECKSIWTPNKKLWVLEDGSMVTPTGFKFSYFNSGAYWWCNP